MSSNPTVFAFSFSPDFDGMVIVPSVRALYEAMRTREWSMRDLASQHFKVYYTDAAIAKGSVSDLFLKTIEVDMNAIRAKATIIVEQEAKEYADVFKGLGSHAAASQARFALDINDTIQTLTAEAGWAWKEESEINFDALEMSFVRLPAEIERIINSE